MKHQNKLSIISLLTTALLTLSACGGNTDTSTSINDSGHPDFSWAKVAVSNNYSPSGSTTNLTPTFSWKAVSGATEYNFGHQFTNGQEWREYTVPAASAGCATGSTCTFKPANHIFNEGEQIVWWVRGKVVNRWKAWSSPYVFNIVGSGSNLPTSAPVAITPNGGTLKDNSPVYTWSDASKAKKYVIGIEKQDGTSWQAFSVSGRENCPVQVECPSTSARPNVDISNGSYTWWMRAERLDGSWSNWSNGHNFSINSADNFSFENLSPSGTINTLSPTFQWKHIAGATEYRIGFDDNNIWTEHTFFSSTNCKINGDCKFQVTNARLKGGDTVSWYVRQKRGGTWLDWNDGKTFTISASTPTPPAAPINFRVYATSPGHIQLRWDRGLTTNGLNINVMEVYRDGIRVARQHFFRNGRFKIYDDYTVESGKTYTYTVKAIDSATNASKGTDLIVTVQ